MCACLQPGETPKLPFLELVLADPGGNPRSCSAAALWVEGPGRCSALLSGCDFSECLGVVFVLTSHANELPVLNSPWCTGFNSPPPTTPSPHSFLSPSPWITHSTTGSPVLFCSQQHALPASSHPEQVSRYLARLCSLSRAVPSALPLAATSVGWLLSVPQGPVKTPVRCGMVPLMCCTINCGVCAPCCSSCWFAAVQWRHQ